MKNVCTACLILAVFALLTGCCSAPIFNTRVDGASIRLAWDPPLEIPTTDPSHFIPKGYKILAGKKPGHYTEQLDVGNVLQYSVSGLREGERVCFAIFAYSAAGTLSNTPVETCSIARASTSIYVK